MDLNKGPVDRVVIAGGDNWTMDQAVKMVTHTFNGLEGVEPALMLMKDKPKDLIKPLVIL